MLPSRGSKASKAALGLVLSRGLRRHGYDKEPARLAREFKISAAEAQDLLANKLDAFSVEQIQGMVDALS